MKSTPIFTFLAVVAGLIFASGAFALELRGGAMHSGDSQALIGSEVRDADGRDLGRITDIRMNGVHYAEVTAGTGQTYLVPIFAFRADREGRFVMLNAGEQIPDQFYGVAPYWEEEVRLLVPEPLPATPQVTEFPPYTSID